MDCRLSDIRHTATDCEQQAYLLLTTVESCSLWDTETDTCSRPQIEIKLGIASRQELHTSGRILGDPSAIVWSKSKDQMRLF